MCKDRDEILISLFTEFCRFGRIEMEIKHQLSTPVNFNTSQMVLEKCVPVSSYNFDLDQLKKGPSNTLLTKEEVWIAMHSPFFNCKT